MRGGRVHEPARTVAVFSGGGTGGHLYPALALADALVERRPDVHPVFVGASRGLEARVLPARGEDHHLLPVEGLRRGAPLENVRVLARLVRSVARVAGLYRRLRPELVVVTGGYAGGPAGIVAAAMGVPLALQEQNSLPGVTTRWLSRWARQIHVAFPEAAEALSRGARERVRVSGNPIREPRPLDRAEARRRFDLEPGGRVALVVGGSQGSAALNDRVRDALTALRERGESLPPELQLLWATGPAHLEPMREAFRGPGLPDRVRMVGYIDDMPAALAAADVAVSRAGAMATSEFLAWGLPAILVPLPTAAADHQTRNAEALHAAGAALHLPESGVDGPGLWAALTGLLSDPARLEAMSRAAHSRGRPIAAAEIAGWLERLLPPPPRGTAPRASGSERPGSGGSGGAAFPPGSPGGAP